MPLPIDPTKKGLARKVRSEDVLIDRTHVPHRPRGIEQNYGLELKISLEDAVEIGTHLFRTH